jgi:hypothetical protein
MSNYTGNIKGVKGSKDSGYKTVIRKELYTRFELTGNFKGTDMLGEVFRHKGQTALVAGDTVTLTVVSG